jgi:hypothetical protein
MATTTPIHQYHAEQFLADALAHAEANGLDVKETLMGVEFYDADGEVEHWDFNEPGAEESVRY